MSARLIPMRIVGGSHDGRWTMANPDEHDCWQSWPTHPRAAAYRLAMAADDVTIEECTCLHEHYRRHEIWQGQFDVWYYLAPYDWSAERALRHLFGHEEFMNRGVRAS